MDHQHIHIHTNFNNDIYARLALTNCILKQLTHNTHLYIARATKSHALGVSLTPWA